VPYLTTLVTHHAIPALACHVAVFTTLEAIAGGGLEGRVFFGGGLRVLEKAWGF